MNRTHARIIGGLFATVFAASAAALGFGACANAADDCRNIRTCEFCNMDAGDPLEGVNTNCCVPEDGGTTICAD